MHILGEKLHILYPHPPPLLPHFNGIYDKMSKDGIPKLKVNGSNSKCTQVVMQCLHFLTCSSALTGAIYGHCVCKSVSGVVQ